MKKNQTVKIILTILISAVAAGGIFCGAVGVYVYDASVHAVNQARRPLECKRESLGKRGFDVQAFEAKYHAEEVSIPSTFGSHQIPANYLTPNGDKKRKTVVMAHGLNGNRLTGYPVAEMFLRHGYNVLTYDQRASGESTAEYMTCGYWESRDFKDCVDYVRQRTGPQQQVGGWGSSIGGATVGFYLGTSEAQEKLDFAVLDCPVSNMREILGFLVRKTKWLPMEFKLDMGDMITKLKLGYSYEDGNVCSYVHNTTVPVLIFHTEKDKITPFHMGADLYGAMKKNQKEILSVTDSGHTDIYFDHPRLYEKTMFRFIQKYTVKESSEKENENYY